MKIFILLYGLHGGVIAPTFYTVAHKQYKWYTYDIHQHVMVAAKKYNVPPALIVGVIYAESEGYKRARGPIITQEGKRSRALGLMQVSPIYHWKHKNPDLLFDPKHNIFTGTRYLSYCIKLAKGNYKMALKNYNSGPASRFYNTPYIKKVLRIKNKLENSV